MIKTFAQAWLEDFWNEGKHKHVPPELGRRLIRKLDMLNPAPPGTAPPSNHLHPLHGNRRGQWAISVSGPWRLCFRFQDGEVFDLELVQYH